MELTPEQQKQLDEQKANCIFCQIIGGKIPTKEVYSDKLTIGILDINPAAQGHVLFMPKEHYPIMPLIPPETFKQIFIKTRDLDASVKKALLCNQTTVFIANGGAAGQQSAHFMLHIIPREKGDELPFDLRGSPPSEDEKKELRDKVGGILNAMLTKNLAALGYIKPPAGGAGAGSSAGAGGAIGKVSRQQLMHLINANPQIKQLILEKPEQFKELVPQHPQLSQLFGDFDLDEIIAEVKKAQEPTGPKTLKFGEEKGSGKEGEQ